MVLLTNLQYKQCRNRDSDGRDDRQMTFLNFIPTFKIYVFLYSRQTDRQTDIQTEKLIWCGLGNLSVPPGGTFFCCLKKIPPATY